MKLVTVVGTRPEVIRLSAFLAVVDKFFDHRLIHTGQNFTDSLNGQFFKELKLRAPDYHLDITSKSWAAAIGQMFERIHEILEDFTPDAFLVLGDTNSCLTAYVAKRLQIPIFHVEAGNRCFDQRVPEEINRKVIDHIADVNVTYSDIARQYLIAEGFDPHRVIKLGSPLYEVKNRFHHLVKQSNILEQLGLRRKSFIVLSLHRHETIADKRKLNKLSDILVYINDMYGLPVICSLHPKTEDYLARFNITLPASTILCSPFGYSDYISLQINSALVLSDSGSLTEEASMYGFKSISLRSTHERPEGSEEGVLTFEDLGSPRLNSLIDMALDENFSNVDSKEMVTDYIVPNFSIKLVKIIASYTGYVDREVWKKV